MLKPTKTEKINFITEFPEINPEKCLKTSPFIGGKIIMLILSNFNLLQNISYKASIGKGWRSKSNQFMQKNNCSQKPTA